MSSYDADLRPALRLLHRQQVRGARRDLAAALRDLEQTKKADAFIYSLPVVDIDTWAVQHAPEWIAELEARDGIPHWTTRQKNARQRLTASALRHQKETA